MFIVRDIFHLKFGHYKDAKALFDEAKSKNMFPEQTTSGSLPILPGTHTG